MFQKHHRFSFFCLWRNWIELALFFFYCRYYREFRNALFQIVSEISTVSLHRILFGDETLSLQDNKKIFSSVHPYIVDTNSFRNWLTFYSLFLLLKSHATLEYKVFCLKFCITWTLVFVDGTPRLYLSHTHTHSWPYFVAFFLYCLMSDIDMTRRKGTLSASSFRSNPFHVTLTSRILPCM